jgi:hypothetical protein
LWNGSFHGTSFRALSINTTIITAGREL